MGDPSLPNQIEEGLSTHCETVGIDWERAMVTRILLAAILCPMPAMSRPDRHRPWA